MRLLSKLLSLITLAMLPVIAMPAAPVTIAVASNFVPAARELVAKFATDTGHEVRISAGSTGKLYAQIVNGAPYDIFLAADKQRPALLEAEGFGVSNTRMTYAVGSLVLWSVNPDFDAVSCRDYLEKPGRHHIAIANPDTAPYGAAAREYLLETGLWEQVQAQLVFGENIAQTLQFVATGNASLGFIAKSQSVDVRLPPATCSWPVPQSPQQSLEQQALLLQRAAGNAVAAEFLEFLSSSAAREVMLRHGYTIP